MNRKYKLVSISLPSKDTISTIGKDRQEALAKIKDYIVKNPDELIIEVLEIERIIE